MPSDRRLLAVNGGSSTIKFALFGIANSPSRESAGVIDKVLDYQDATTKLIERIAQTVDTSTLAGIAHRVVLGGPNLTEHQVITSDVLAELKRLRPLDLAYLPGEIALIESLQKAFPGVPQVACFDSAVSPRPADGRRRCFRSPAVTSTREFVALGFTAFPTHI